MEKYVDDWLHNLPVIWMAVVVFGVTYLIAAAIYAVVMVLATGERARAFKAVSPGILSPLGVLFGLFVENAEGWIAYFKAKLAEGPPWFDGIDGSDDDFYFDQRHGLENWKTTLDELKARRGDPDL
jgi:hypothetical protein